MKTTFKLNHWQSVTKEPVCLREMQFWKFSLSRLHPPLSYFSQSSVSAMYVSVKYCVLDCAHEKLAWNNYIEHCCLKIMVVDKLCVTGHVYVTQSGHFLLKTPNLILQIVYFNPHRVTFDKYDCIMATTSWNVYYCCPGYTWGVWKKLYFLYL